MMDREFIYELLQLHLGWIGDYSDGYIARNARRYPQHFTVRENGKRQMNGLCMVMLREKHDEWARKTFQKKMGNSSSR